MVRFLYFGGLPMETLTSVDCLDLLGLAEDVEAGGGPLGGPKLRLADWFYCSCCWVGCCWLD